MKTAATIMIVLMFTLCMNAQENLNFEARLRLAQSFEQSGMLEKAEEIYRELCNSQPWNNFYFELLNKNLVAQKKYNESIQLLDQKIKQTPNDYTLFGALGTTYYIMGEPEKAFSVWEKGIEINPASFVVYRVIANYAIENRAYDKAIDLLKRGRQLSNDPVIFSIDLATIYAANMKFKEAALEFCNLVEHQPEQIYTAKQRMSSFLNSPGASELTIEAVKSFSDSKPKPEIYDLLIFVYQTTGNYKNAFETATKAEKKFAGNGNTTFIFAQEVYRNRQYEWASEAFNYIVKNYQSSPYILASRIGYARSLEAALDQKFLALSGSWKPVTKPGLLFTDEYKKILGVYEEFVNGYSDYSVNAEALFRIAEIYRNRLFDYNIAESVYKKVIRISPSSNYGNGALIALGKIDIVNNNLDIAKRYFESSAINMVIEPNDLSETNYFLAKIEFWKGNFNSSINLLKESTKILSSDFANDALELSAFINSTRKDSLNLLLYAKADLLVLQNKLKEAAVEFKALSDNPNLFIINDFAKIKLAEIAIAENDYSFAIKLLEEGLENKKITIFEEKSTFLLAQCYHYGIKNLQKAEEIYKKLLEFFPNSLYFDRVREQLFILNSQADS